MEAYRNVHLPPEERAADLLGRMTLREKVGQLTQRLYGFACYERHGGDIRLTEEFYREADRYGGIGALYRSVCRLPGMMNMLASDAMSRTT